MNYALLPRHKKIHHQGDIGDPGNNLHISIANFFALTFDYSIIKVNYSHYYCALNYIVYFLALHTNNTCFGHPPIL